MSRTTQPVKVLITAMAGLALVLPASAQAATRPAVATGKATKITATTVHLVGTVNPNGAKTTYLFQYGRTSLYGTSTAITLAGSAKRKRTVQVVRFSGTIRPARNGTRVVIQRLVGRHWRQVAATKARKGGERFSRYAKSVHIRKGGSYRVHVESADGNYVASEGRSVRIHRR